MKFTNVLNILIIKYRLFKNGIENVYIKCTFEFIKRNSTENPGAKVDVFSGSIENT